MVTKAQREREENAAEDKRNRRGMLFTILSLPAGFGSWGYFVLAANPSFDFGVALLLVAALFLAIAVIEFFRSRGIQVLIILGIGVGIWYGFQWAKSEWIKKVNSDIESNLGIILSLPSSGNPFDSLITVVNNSHSNLASHEVMCDIVAASEDGNVIARDVGSILTRKPIPLKIGGDADTRGCMNTEWGGHTLYGLHPPPNICADIQVDVHFQSDGSMAVSGAKQARFVYGYEGNNSWVRESNERPTSYCVKQQ